jgi:flagellar basal body P-ring formation chaperone FlgA
VLGASKLRALRWTAVLMATVAIGLGAQLSRAGTTDAVERTKEAVVRALSLRDGFSGGELTVLRPPLADQVAIHVVSIENAPGPGAALVRLACDSSRDCLPFYALVRGASLPTLSPSKSVALLSGDRPVKPLLRAGDRVEIVEQLSGMNLRTRGVCLQPGSLGSKIRVRTLTSHRILVATVEAPSLVKVER